MPRTTVTPTATGSPAGGPAPVDGRNARRERGRQAVIDAVVDLLHEGHAPPSTADVTARAGVSEATLFRYFESVDDLQLQASQRFLETHAHLFAIPQEGIGPRAARIERFVSARAMLWETIAPVARLGRARAFDHPGMDALLRGARRDQYAQLTRHFAPELLERSAAPAADLLASIATLTSFEAWDTQRRDLDRTPAQVRRAWRSALHAVLGTPPASTPTNSERPPTAPAAGSTTP